MLRYWPTRSETFVAREIRGLQAQGVHVEVFALDPRERGGETPPVPTHWAPHGLRRLALGGARAPEELVAWQGRRGMGRWRWLARALRRRRIDRVHVHFAGEALEVAVAAAAGRPVSVTVHAVDLFRPRSSLASLLPRVQVVTVCEHHRTWLRRVHEVEATVVRCGVDPARYPAADVGGTRRRVLCVARDVPKKGLADLVAAVGRLEGATLRLTADAPALAAPHVRLGAVPRADALLQQCEVFALAARIAPDGDRDGVPVALMEAMAAGVPVVTTAVSGIPELVDDTVGWLVPPDDPQALEAALREALAAPEVRRARGRAARRRIEAGWTVAHQVAGLRSLWGATTMPAEGAWSSHFGPI